MIYELKLDEPFGAFTAFNVEEKRHKVKRLQGFKDLEKRLQYYNDNVRSLSWYSMRPQIRLETYPGNTYEVYCTCRNCRVKDDFEAKERIYFKVRDREVKRIINGLNAAKNYGEKLYFLLKVKGYHLEGSFVIYGNMEVNPEIDSDMQMYVSEPLIDLRPVTKEQIAIYNSLVKTEFNNRFIAANGFSNKYKRFDFDKERERLEKTMKKAIDPKRLVSYCKDQIESHFHYPDSLKTVKINNPIVESIDRQLKDIGWLGHHLFARMVLGVEIDLNEVVLTEAELLRYTHTTEIVKFYKYLIDIMQNKADSPDKPLLKSLMKDNPVYEYFIKEYENKLVNVADFLSKEEFINEEIERVHSEFILPMEIAVGGSFEKAGGFHADKFIKAAYDWLRSGSNPEIQRAITQGQREYTDFITQHSKQYFEANKESELAKIEQGVIAALQRGVAYLMYQKFLKDQIVTGKDFVIEEKGQNEKEMDFVEKHFIRCKDSFNNENDYQTAIREIKSFFQGGEITITKPLFVKGGNIRNMAFAMGEIWKSQKNDPITYNYLQLYKKLFSIFKDQEIDKNHVFSSNLYKYSISKT